MTLTPTRDVSAQDFLDDLSAVVEEVRAGAAERDRTRSYAFAAIRNLRDLGFFAITVPTEYGGLGLGPDVAVRAVLELAAADGSLGQIPQNHFMTLEQIRLTTTGEQRAYWLETVGRGSFFGNATAEPGELHPGERATTLTRHGERLRLDGRKVYSTGALLADHIAVSVKDDTGRPTSVLVSLSHPGVTVHDDWQGLGQRTTASGTSVFEGVLVDTLAVLPAIDDPVAAYRISALGQLLHAAIDAGLAEGAFAEATRLAHVSHGGRGSGAKRFEDDTLGVALFGELSVSVLAARRLVEATATRLGSLTERSTLEEVLDVFYEVAAAKLTSTRAALSVTSGLFDVGGAASTRPDLGHDRYWRDARTHTLHDAARWKPHSIGRWLLAREVADPWSIGHPLRSLADLSPKPDTPGRTR
ncbi:MAG: acyl-CoA dehydrogenase family protein [Nocardioidaceae bacterium]